jgi:hypothetical protein
MQKVAYEFHPSRRWGIITRLKLGERNIELITAADREHPEPQDPEYQAKKAKKSSAGRRTKHPNSLGNVAGVGQVSL